MATQRVYLFKDGDVKNKKLLWNKCSGLCKMTQIEFPVSEGFVITTEQCKAFITNGNKM